jgi:hypothetical protein
LGPCAPRLSMGVAATKRVRARRTPLGKATPTRLRVDRGGGAQAPNQTMSGAQDHALVTFTVCVAARVRGRRAGQRAVSGGGLPAKPFLHLARSRSTHARDSSFSAPLPVLVLVLATLPARTPVPASRSGAGANRRAPRGESARAAAAGPMRLTAALLSAGRVAVARARRPAKAAIEIVRGAGGWRRSGDARGATSRRTTRALTHAP